jgi:hypothetical protein
MKTTKKLLAFLLSVCMVLTMFAGLTLPVGATTTYTASLITSDSDLTSGGLYMIVQDGHAAINTISSSTLTTTDTYSTTGLTGTESYVWTLAGSANLFTITSAASSAFTVGGASSATSLNSTGGSTWYIAYDTTNSWWQIRLASATGRFWGYTTSSSYAYKIYANTNYSGTTYPHNIQLYKLTANAAAATLTSIAVSGQTTSYTVGDAFSFNGTCTATYSDGTTADGDADGFQPGHVFGRHEDRHGHLY